MNELEQKLYNLLQRVELTPVKVEQIGRFIHFSCLTEAQCKHIVEFVLKSKAYKQWGGIAQRLLTGEGTLWGCCIMPR